MSAMKKQRKAKATSRKKKRQRAKNKRLREKGIIVKQSDYADESKPTKNEESKPTRDTTHYSFKTPQEDQYVIIRFSNINPDKTDSIFVRYNKKGDDVLDYDKQILKMYLDSNGVVKITLVRIKEHVGSAKDNEHRNKQVTPIKRNIANYFIELGIPPEKIQLK